MNVLGRWSPQQQFNFLGALLLFSLFFSFLSFPMIVGFVASGLIILSMLHSGRSSRFPVEGVPFLCLVFLCVLSTLWSPVPDKTLKASLEFVISAVFAIYLCRAVSMNTVLVTLWACATVLGLICLPYLPAVISSGGAMIAVFGSKNANAFSAEFWCFISAYIALERRHGLALRGAAAVCAALAVAYVFYSRAAGSMVAVGLFSFFMAVGYAYLKIPARFRLLAIVAMLPIVIGFLVAAPDLYNYWQDFQVNVLQKDSTLTGRTTIWATADSVSRDHPWLGIGYAAFWTQGNLYAEGLWRTFQITSRAGFNFHNVFVEYKVGLGIVGMVLMILLYIYVGVFIVYELVTRPSMVNLYLFSYTTSIYLHSFSEDALGSQFNVATFFWMAAPGLLLEMRKGRRGPIDMEPIAQSAR